MTLLDAVTTSITDHEDVDGEAMVTGFVLIASFVGTDGEGRIYHETLDGQRCHETLGLLAYALARENARAIEDSDDD